MPKGGRWPPGPCPPGTLHVVGNGAGAGGCGQRGQRPPGEPRPWERVAGPLVLGRQLCLWLPSPGRRKGGVPPFPRCLDADDSDERGLRPRSVATEGRWSVPNPLGPTICQAAPLFCSVFSLTPFSSPSQPLGLCLPGGTSALLSGTRADSELAGVGVVGGGPHSDSSRTVLLRLDSDVGSSASSRGPQGWGGAGVPEREDKLALHRVGPKLEQAPQQSTKLET